jgi:hypothetical protein
VNLAPPFQDPAEAKALLVAVVCILIVLGIAICLAPEADE